MDWLLRWQTLVFLAPLCLGIMLVAGLAFGAGIESEAEVDADSDAHGDLETPSHGLLELLGVGRVPLSLLLLTLVLLFGTTGLALTALLESSLPSLYMLVSFPAATLVSLFGTRHLAGLVSRHLPTLETYRVSSKDLVGRVGQAIVEVTPEDGFAQVKDHEGNLHQVRCRSTGAVLPKGAALLLLEHESEGGFYLVEFFETDAPGTRAEAPVKAGTRSRA